jgi:FdhD protein
LIGTGKHAASIEVIRCESGICRKSVQELIGEEPLLIRIDEKPYSVVMRTPGEEVAHAAGFCLGEGIVDSADDFAAIGYCQDLDPNVIEVRLKPARRERINEILERRGFVSQTSCGICGKEMLKDLRQVLKPVQSRFQLEVDRVLDCIDKLAGQQKYYPRTRGSHAAMLLNRRLEIVSFAEDVGRHNALDKAIGKAFINGKLRAAAILVLSSRMSYELVQKAARAQLPILISMSRPTTLAAEMGKALDMTLVCRGKGSELVLICGNSRIVFECNGGQVIGRE